MSQRDEPFGSVRSFTDDGSPCRPPSLRNFWRRVAAVRAQQQANLNRNASSRNLPVTSDQATQTDPEPRQDTSYPCRPARTLRTSPDQCWRCGGYGHRRGVCTGSGIIFCSRCGRVGILSRCCRCPPGRTERPPKKTVTFTPPWELYRQPR